MERERHAIAHRQPLAPETSASIGDVVPGVVRTMGLESRLWERTLADEWPSLVGPQLAQHARPGRYDRKTLYIFVDHPTWLNELSRYGQKEILAKLQARYGAERIRQVRLQLDPEPPA